MSVVPLIGPTAAPRRARSQSIAVSFNAVHRVAGWFAREMRIRRDMRRLAEFDDSMLRDIGIARADIEGAVRCGRAIQANSGSSEPT